MTVLSWPLPGYHDAPLGSGGFATVFRSKEDADLCIKVYNEPLEEPARSRVLTLVELRQTARPSDRAVLESRFAWPLECFGDDRHLFAYSMRVAPSTSYFRLKTAGKERPELLQLKFLIDQQYWAGAAVQSAPPEFSQTDRLMVSIDLGDALAVLHEHGLYFGDLSSNNIAVVKEPSPRVFLIDADSILPANSDTTAVATSMTWGVNGVSDGRARDRILFARAVWRLLTQRPYEEPGPGKHVIESDGSLDQLVEQLIACHEHGDAASFEGVMQALHRAAPVGARKRAFQAAMDSAPFARVVVRHARAPGVVEGHELLAAHAQLELESEVDAAPPRRRQLLERRVARTGFAIDVRSTECAVVPPRTEGELIDLMFAAQFEEIVNHLYSGNLGHLGSHRWLDRIVEDWLASQQPPAIDVWAGDEMIDVAWDWPVNDHYVNCAVVTVTGLGGSVDVHVSRLITEHAPRRSFAVPGGGSVEVQLRFAVAADEIVRAGRQPGTALVTVRAKPRPRPPATGGGFTWTQPEEALGTIPKPRMLEPVTTGPQPRFGAKRWTVAALAAVIALTTLLVVLLVLLAEPDDEAIIERAIGWELDLGRLIDPANSPDGVVLLIRSPTTPDRLIRVEDGSSTVLVPYPRTANSLSVLVFDAPPVEGSVPLAGPFDLDVPVPRPLPPRPYSGGPLVF